FPLSAISSGLIGAHLFLAHTRANPFDDAFNITAADVWALVNSHVDQHADEASGDSVAQCKERLLEHCVQTYNGYIYGQRNFVFNTHCIVNFFAKLGSAIRVGTIPRSVHTLWPATSNLSLIRSLCADDIDEFGILAGLLLREFMQWNTFRYGDDSVEGALTRKLRAMNVNAELVHLPDSSEALAPKDADSALLDLARACFVDQPSSKSLDWSAGDQTVATIFRVFYQAGLLTRLSNGSIGIPNDDAFDSFREWAVQLLSPSGSEYTLNATAYKDVGIGTGDLVVFARFLDRELASIESTTVAKWREPDYQSLLYGILVPLRIGSFTVRREEKAEGGRADITIRPPPTKRPADCLFVVLELKQINSKSEPSHEKAMAPGNRMNKVKIAKGACLGALDQIYE
ncbi:hypothetical protein H4R27_006373, partial [Coemansia aciculifera]